MAGQSFVAGQFEQLGWGVSRNSDHDLGTDLWLMVRDERRFDLGLLLGAQVKAGRHWFKEPELDETGAIVGWWYRESNMHHFDYWLGHSIRHVLIIHNPETGYSHWARIEHSTVESTGKGAKVLVPLKATVSASNIHKLQVFAGAAKPYGYWEGTAWSGAPQVQSRDRLRYALIAPRLMSPHPNTSPQTITAEQAIAMLVQVRIDDLRHREPYSSLIPSPEDACASANWEWKLYGQMHKLIVEGTDLEIETLLSAANHPHQRAAAIVVAVNALLEDGAIQAAKELLGRYIDVDEASPVDHGWLQTQYARCFLETGQLDAAQALAIAVQGLRESASEDPTAGAIVAAATEIVFRSSDWTAGDVRDVITSGDTVANWWRTQEVSRGLSRTFENSFTEWSDDASVRTGGDHEAWRHLRAASLIASYTGDSGGWRNALSRLGKDGLTSTNAKTDPERVSRSLDLLRLTGDDKALSVAVRRVVRRGPAAAATLAVERVNFADSTVSAALAEIKLVSSAADVLPADVADRHALWAIATIVNPSDFVARTRPTFAVRIYLLRLLASLVPAVSDSCRDAIRHFVLAPTAQTDKGEAHEYARIIRSLQTFPWNDSHLEAMSTRPPGDDVEFQEAIDSVLRTSHPATREKLIKLAREGSIHVLPILVDVTDLPIDAVEALIANYTKAIDTQTDQAVAGQFNMRSQDLARNLVVLNMNYPSLADWTSLIRMISVPIISPEHTVGTLRLLASHPDEVPNRVRSELRPPLEVLASFDTPHRRYFDKEDPRGPAAEAIAALWPLELAALTDWDLISGDDSQRESWALILARTKDPGALTALATLAADTSVTVGEAGIHGMARWVASGIALPASQRLLLQALEASTGTATSLAAVGVLSESGADEAVRLPLEFLSNSVSAHVRRLATEALMLRGSPRIFDSTA